MSNGDWQNPDGVQVRFPDWYKNADNQVNRARSLLTYGAVKQIEVDIDLTRIAHGVTYFPADLDNDGTADGFTQHDAYLPAYSSIVSCLFICSEAGAGGTNLDVGLYEADGSVIDADGLFVDLLTAEMTLGSVSHGDGALVQASGIAGAGVGAADAHISLTPSGTFTAGKGRLIIEYLSPVVDS